MSKTLVLIPGLLSDGFVWQPVVEAFDEKFSVVVADVSAGVSLTTIAEDVLEQNRGQLIVAGHSMGARIALEMVRLAPERIEKLALMDTGVHPPAAGEAEKRQVLVDLLYAQGMEAAEQWLLPMVHEARHLDAKLMDGLRAMIMRASPTVFEGQVRALLDRPEAQTILREISCPTLLVVGRQDNWSPVAQHEAMLADLNNGRLVVIENAGHFAPIERPEAVIAAMQMWLSGWDAGITPDDK